ncbi:MAG: 2-dehydropantoate 2-reductase [Opitutaceae bacterium]
MSVPFQSVAVVGSGAIGIYYGMRLAFGGADVKFLLRGDLAAVRRRGSLILHLDGETRALQPVAAFGSTREIGPVDLALVTLKTTANATLPDLLPPLIGRETILLTLQNGLGSDEFLAERFGAERVMGGLAFIANIRVGPGEVKCFHPGSLSLGRFGGGPTERLRGLAWQFEASGVETRVAEHLEAARWQKLVWNIPFNGLSIAAGGVATDRICADPSLAAEARALMREVRAGAAALGHPIADDFLDQQFATTPPMGAYRPSSLVDFLAGREIEVESIWGEPLRRAGAAGAALPRLALLYSVLRGLNAGARKSPKSRNERPSRESHLRA